MFSIFCMKQIFTFRAGFIPSLVIWQNFVCYWNFSDTIFCFTTDNIKILFIKMNILFLQIKHFRDAAKLLDRIKNFVSSFRLFAPTIEEYANQVEADKTIEAGNSFRGIFNELGKLLEAFKELIKEGLCWFPRLMRWKTSRGEVAQVFLEKSNGYSYSLYGCGY